MGPELGDLITPLPNTHTLQDLPHICLVRPHCFIDTKKDFGGGGGGGGGAWNFFGRTKNLCFFVSYLL